jgi:hypothetical protein
MRLDSFSGLRRMALHVLQPYRKVDKQPINDFGAF